MWHTGQLKFAIGLGTLLSFYGIVTLIVAFAPTEKYGYDLTYKVVLIALLLLTLPFAIIIAVVSSRRKKKKEEAKKKEAEAKTNEQTSGASAQQQQKLATPAGASDDITQAAEETVQFLKSSNLGVGKDPVYSLPWYIVAGTPKSGKSSLTLASELNFQPLPSQRQSEMKFIRPTRNIDWRVTSDAVFLDTAGRYQTEGVDQEEWSSILETVKKYRAVRPIDGLILTANTERILHADEKEIEEMAKVLRARIDEAVQRTKIRFPIYLVFTHADAIEGFRDSFSNSQREGKNLVWGATIPLEKTENAHALFDPEYDLLHNSVMKRRLMRLSAPFPAIRQIKIFNFPLHFGSARKKLGHFVSTLFRPNPFSESPFLRGFYFTAVPVNRPQAKGNQTMTNIGQTVGQSYFTEKLFRDVILRDKDLVATFQAQKVSPPIMGWLLTFLGAILIIALLAFAGYSLYLNKLMVELATKRGVEVLVMYRADAAEGGNVLNKGPEKTQIEFNTIENLRKSMVDLDKFDREGPPLVMRFGLYSGERIYHAHLLNIYFNVVEQRFSKPTVKRVEDELRKFTASKPVVNPSALTKEEEELLSKNYDLLKAYLMLSREYKSHAEENSIITALSEFWTVESKAPPEFQETAKAQLDFWAKQATREEFPPIKLDDALVESVRQKLLPFPAVYRYYKRVTTQISKDVNGITANVVLGSNSYGVMEGTYVVPGAFTLKGYREHMLKAISDAKVQLGQDDWVMGDKVQKAKADDEDIQRFQDKYYKEYADHWQNFVRGVSIPEYKTKEEALNAMRAFNSNNSPMTIIIKKVAEETNLSAKPKSTGIWGWIMSWFESKEDDTIGDTTVEKQFAPLFGLVKEGEKKEPSPITQYATDYARLATTLDGKNNDDIKKMTEDFTNQRGTITVVMKEADTSIGNRIKSFEGNDATSAARDLAGLLRKPINNLKVFFGAAGIEQLQSLWTSQILTAARAVEKGYPFDNNGEVDLAKLAGYLAEGGTLPTFYKNIEKYFDGTPGQLKVKESSPVKFSDEFVNYLNNAFRLQNTLFPDKSKTAKFGYSLTLQKVDNVAVEGTVDGQDVKAAGATSAFPLIFPASSGNSGVLMNFTSTDGSGNTSTSKPPTATGTPANSSANSSTPPVNPGSSPVTKPKGKGKKPAAPTGPVGPVGLTPLNFPGTWGLFKFFDAGAANKNATTGEYTLTFAIGNKKILTVLIKPTGGDLFDKTYFTSVKAPEKILK